MEIRKVKFISGSVLILAIFMYSYMIVFGIQKNSISPLCWVTFALIGAISVAEIIKDTYNYSLNKIHWYFIFIFMFLSPLSQLTAGYYPWKHTLQTDTVLYANVLLIVWEVVYVLGYRQLRNKRFIVGREKEKKSVEISLTKPMYFFLLTASLMSLLLMIAKCGLSNLFIRDAGIFGDGIFSLMITYLLRSIPVLSSGIFILSKRKGNRISWMAIVVLLICTFILNFPVAMSRYWTGSVYLGILLCAIPPELFKNRRFDYCLIFALAVAFPIFSYFKYNTFVDLVAKGVQLDVFSIYNNVDFDAYSMFCRIIEYTKSNDFTYGTQLRSVIFFFVPRAIWNIKGTPTGTLVATAQNSYYTNVSAPLMGEGYIDFGVIGVVVYAFIMSRILLNLDRKYWSSLLDESVKYSDLVFVYLAGFILFLMRGALQPSFLRVMGFFLFLMGLYFLQKLFRNLDSSKKARSSFERKK